MRASASLLKCVAAMIVLSVSATVCRGIEKEVSLVTKEAIGDLAVAGRLDIDLHADFMVSRTFEKDTALNWYNCGLSGGGKITDVGGTSASTPLGRLRWACWDRSE